MSHSPDARNGLGIIRKNNQEILNQLEDQADMAMAKQNADRDASIKAIKERHANELKSAKRNHKHRAKKIKDKMKFFEDMDPVEFANHFINGVYNEFGFIDLQVIYNARQCGKSSIIDAMNFVNNNMVNLSEEDK